MTNRSITLILVVYYAVSTLSALLFFVLWLTYECPEVIREADIRQETVQEIKEIINAESKTDIDSLLHELYDFKSK
tara:strand:+ start:3248 stop:3475 length:228 start_codon:yes stop_codon:yes gene_type:complete